jgi:hypothetical protein
MGNGGEIFVLDMGEPVKIVDLARDLIRLSGFEPERDIEIKFTGMRPGEKLFEELAVDEENVEKTKHPKIFVGRFRPHPIEEIERGLAELHLLSDGHDETALRRAFKSIVPEYMGISSADVHAEKRASAAKLPSPASVSALAAGASASSTAEKTEKTEKTERDASDRKTPEISFIN